MIEFLLMLIIPARVITINPPSPIVIENVILTAYSSSEDETDSDPHITASNQEVHEGVIANNCWPFGTRLAWGGKIFIVKDRMNARYECNHVDIWHRTAEEAIQFGKQRSNLVVLEYGKSEVPNLQERRNKISQH